MGMILRVILYLALIYMVLALIKRYVIDPGRRARGGGGRGGAFPRDAAKVDPEVMETVQDPVCGGYIPMDSALSIKDGRKTTYFCSEHCRDEYQKTAKR